MATFDGKFIRGAAGDLIFKKNGKKQVVQGKSKKAKIDMTQATFDAAFVFGRASTLASYIRGNIEKIVRYYDGGMISRFTGECNQILQKATTGKDNEFDFSQDYFSRLNGFEFNDVSLVKSCLFAQPVVSLTEQTATIDFPEMQIPKDIKFPSSATYCVVAFSVTLFDLKNDQYKSQEVQSFEIELKNHPFTFPAQQLNFEGAPGALCVIALGLYYFEKTFAGKAMINNKDLSPSAILKAAFCPGEIDIQNKWREMIFKEKKTRKLKKPKKQSDQTT
ncbi:hypothetical protein [Pedobacter nyackensis]|uniref:Uncharacterized protein n=1 Tax=Pedobacter nyackensis TaxID=475255 RepID=A0A1W2BLL0_9SPHI|nr:hypothetical protein [Pedobacter nyackensis]SMC73750.1 hypothetical protein SAMN04488101_102594 [Pedobacter nyackensis]